jgi:hypothetical protein
MPMKSPLPDFLAISLRIGGNFFIFVALAEQNDMQA